ncbi:hypothetical protein IV203_021779 [Nitzschia inconspicua]|uniref:Uncharacterized protein n=1 Tax=Nitzschia inconspicua TaxID=303405 RepID=A0A9K3KIB4_9STRA|nr:hypothetical protein IV203_021779 [Nitzschia inconspicua]
MKASLQATFLLSIAFLASSVTAQSQSCSNDGEEVLEFRFFTDAQSYIDNGWNLECEYDDGSSTETIWSVQPGTLRQSDSTEVIREATCVEPTTTCWLTIVDLKGDGLLAEYPTDGFTGWFTLVYGATTVAVYSNEPTPEFEELQYCVGPKCNMIPQEVSAGVDTKNSNCEEELAYLYLQTDGKPQDTSYHLECNGETLWKRDGLGDAGAYIEEETCITKDMCCTFTINDGDTNGMTTPTDIGAAGYVFLEWNFEVLLEYDGITGEEFDTKTVEFGYGCGDEQPYFEGTIFPAEDVAEAESYGEYDIFGAAAAARNRGLSDTAKVVLLIVTLLTLFCCIAVLLCYRRALLRDELERSPAAKDDHTVVSNPTSDDDKTTPQSNKHVVTFGDDISSCSEDENEIHSSW